MKEVYVFKTSAKTARQIYNATQLLSTLECIQRIDFDPEDCDNILRIESTEQITHEVIELLNLKGIFCEELN